MMENHEYCLFCKKKFVVEGRAMRKNMINAQNNDDEGRCGGGFLPGFGAASVVGAVVIYCWYDCRKRR